MLGSAQAALLFGSMMEAMETSTYVSMANKISSPDLLNLMAAMFPLELAHYTALQVTLMRMLQNQGQGQGGDPTTGIGGGAPAGGTGTGGTGGTGGGGADQGFFSLAFPALANPLFADRPGYAASILPTPAVAISGLPYVAAVRPRRMSATRAVEDMVRANLFQGQPQAFLDMLRQAAADADRAMRSTTAVAM
jgi:hypothetical protein